MRHYFVGLKRAVTSAAEGKGASGAVKKTMRVLKNEGLGGIARRVSLFCRRSVTRRTNRPKIKNDFSFEIPFKYQVARRPDTRACAIIHIYYVDLAAEIRSYVENVPGQLDLYISTISQDAKDRISNIFADFSKGSVQVRIFENRGRDIATKLVGFADVYVNYDYVLSLHTKKSTHGGRELKNWRNYLYENLLGSYEVVNSIFTLLENERVGMVFPQHFYFLQNILDWGETYDSVYELMQKMGVQMDESTVLECPSGSMFWCRAEALRSLLNLNLSFHDFPAESGQIDGTLAHAIERLFLYAVENEGFKWAKVVKRNLYPLSSTVLPVTSIEDVRQGMALVFRPLLRESPRGLNS
jgi:lipopolysaccharide biosynthesis protein